MTYPLAPPPPTGQPIDRWFFLLWKFAKAILPDQSGNSGKYLKTDGTDASWATVSGSGGGSVPNVIASATTIDAETSYLVMDHLTVNNDLTVNGYLGVTDLGVGSASGTGTVTSTSVVSANGFAGTVATATTTPAITMSTSITGILKGNGTAISAATVDVDYASALPSGIILPYGGSSAPSGWLLCDGSAVNRTTYAALFTAISTAFGVGDGSTTFNLPNTARKTLVGAGGTGTATLANTVGSNGGSETHTLTTAELAVHSHGVTDPTHSHNYYLPNSDTAGAGVAVGVSSDGAALTATTSSSTGISVNNAGSGTAHNNLQPSLVVNYIIKT